MMNVLQARQEALARGFSHVLSYGGPIPIPEWDPYGFLGVNYHPGGRQVALAWHSESTMLDGVDLPPMEPFIAGRWQFLTPEETQALLTLPIEEQRKWRPTE